MGDNQPVERIAGPADIKGRIKQIDGHGVVDGPARIPIQGIARTGSQPHTLGFLQKGQFEKTDWRDVQTACAHQAATTRVSRMYPNESVGIEQNHTLDLGLKSNPALPDCHVQFPSSTAGSRISMTDAAGAGLRRASSKTMRKRNFPRSMVTGLPFAAWSRTPAKFWRACVAVYRGICTLYN